jgi:hypothetical protein
LDKRLTKLAHGVHAGCSSGNKAIDNWRKCLSGGEADGGKQVMTDKAIAAIFQLPGLGPGSRLKWSQWTRIRDEARRGPKDGDDQGTREQGNIWEQFKGHEKDGSCQRGRR